MSDAFAMGQLELAARLDVFQRIQLGHWPTPIDALPRLGSELGVQLWTKRDDCTGLGGGGNKVRKLEYLLAAALAADSDVVLTAGAIQSNHARITAAAAARLGIACEVILTTPEGPHAAAYSASGNRLLDALFGARVHELPHGADSAPQLAARAAELDAQGSKSFVIPIGGSNGLGTLGYLAAALELAEQSKVLGLAFDVIVLPTGSGGTQAGLALAGALMRQAWHIIGVSVGRMAAAQRAKVTDVIGESCRLLDLPEPDPLDVDIFDDARLPGYGMPSAEANQAILGTARREGLLLDPVYTGKAMAGLHMLVARGRIPRGSRVLFWHTGGAPALFGYQDSLARELSLHGERK